MGPIQRYLGPLVPQETLLWQDPVPAVDHELVDADDVAALKAQVLESGSPSRSWSPPRGPRPRRSAAATSAVAPTVPGSACSRRAAGRSTTPTELAQVLRTLEGIQQSFNAVQVGGKKISLADLIVLGGVAGVEKAARDAGHPVAVAVHPGPHRRDGRADRRRVVRLRSSRPRTGSATTRARATGCRPSSCWSTGPTCSALSAPEMTVLVGGLRVLGANTGQLARPAC